MLSIEKSKKQAQSILMINLYMQQIDIPYLTEVKKAIIDKAMFTEATAVINRNYHVLKSEIISKQANALQKLIEYDGLIKEITKLKNDLEEIEGSKKELDNLFI